MAIDSIAFVDSISATANIRLNLSAAPWSVLFNGTDLTPPPFRRAVVSTLLTDGSIIPAAAYDNRTITLHLQCDASSPGLAATQLQLLNRELDRPNNILKWQPEPSIPAVYFRTFRSPDYVDNHDHGINLYDFVLSIQAEPFAYGLQENSTSTVTINNDPTAGSNGKYFEVTGVKGDVETPVMFKLGGGIANHQSVFAMRRGGTPSAAPFFLQAEAMTQGTNTSTQANSATYSGSGNNSSVTTFGSSNDLTHVRLLSTFPSSASVDVRGQYRVYLRAHASSGSNTFAFQLGHGQRPVTNTERDVTFASITNGPRMIDLGLVQMPEGFDPGGNGPSGVALPVAGVAIGVFASRLSGSGNLIYDYLLFMPADDRQCLVNWGATSVTQFVLDGYSRTVYALNSSGQIQDNGISYFTGDIPYFAPNVINRVCYINDVTPEPSLADLNSGTCTLDWFYWPRYLYVRPVTT
jgi:hypothetical protein